MATCKPYMPLSVANTTLLHPTTFTNGISLITFISNPISEQILASDGGTIVLDWHEPTITPDITIVIVPGIASSSEACAIRHFVKRCTESTKVKLRVIVYNHRGCTDTDITV